MALKNLKNNPLQFAVVREDPSIELEVFRRFGIKKPVFIASGGCTALSLAQAYPNLTMTLIEPNLSQISLIKMKIRTLATKNKKRIQTRFSVGRSVASHDSMVESGNFESLFRQFRSFLHEFVCDEKTLLTRFQKNAEESWRDIFSHPYWPVAYELFFSDAMLRAMFGDAAIQHAPKGSYPSYFRKALEKGLLRRDRSQNYFLHHIFLGHYLRDRECLPPYLMKSPKKVDVRFIHSVAEKVESYAPFDFVGLSNIFDWSSEKNVRFLARRLCAELKSGSVVVFRQLNNREAFVNRFGDAFTWCVTLAKTLLRQDRSLFYSSLHIGVKK